MKYGKKEVIIPIVTGFVAFLIIILNLGLTTQAVFSLFEYLNFLPIVFRVIFTGIAGYLFLVVTSMVLLYISLRLICKLFPLKEGVYLTNSKIFHNWQVIHAWKTYSSFVYRISPVPNFIGMYTLKWAGLKTKGGGLFSTSSILEPTMTEVGKDVLIGDQAMITGHTVESGKFIFKKIKIGDNATISAKATILPGVTVGDNSIVASCALVPKNTVIPPNEIWGGVPAKFIKKIE